MHTILDAIATANPPFKRTQMEVADFMAKVEGLSAPVRNRIASVYARSGIDYRYSCIGDYGADPAEFEFYPKNWELKPAPTTGDRNQKYQTCALDLACQAAQQALWQAAVANDAVTHLIVVSCTGFSAPGLDIYLVKRLGLPPTTARTLIGFMGCHAAFNGLKVCHTICQTDVQARVLLVCVELCSLHFQIEDSLESVVTNAIFSDGAAAAILSARSPEAATGQLAYVDGYSVLTDDSIDLMSWTIGDRGFLMRLSPQVPNAVAAHLPAYLDAFLGHHQLSPTDLDFWAIHPGGRRIIEQIQVVLGLSDDLVNESYEILRLYGNMSSPTVLFILKRLLDRHQIQQRSGKGFQNGVALAFGPGISIEGCLFQQV